MKLLFFIPGANAVTEQLLIDHALNKLLTPSTKSRQTFAGPGGRSGIIITDDPDLPEDDVGFDNARQTWDERFGYSSLVGSWNGEPPAADELLRDEGIVGNLVTLLDGRQWHVPKLRAWQMTDTLHYSVRLPRVLKQSPKTGDWLLTNVVPQYSALWQSSLAIADKLFSQLVDQASASLEYSELFGFAVELLQVNYRVDASVLSHLGVLHVDNAITIVREALDWPTLEAYLKKAVRRLASDGTNSKSGATLPIAD